MSNKKNKFPFANEVKEMKDNFKKMIDSMSDSEFIDFIAYINSDVGLFDDDDNDDFYVGDEGWEDEAAKFYGYDVNDKREDDSLPF